MYDDDTGKIIIKNKTFKLEITQKKKMVDFVVDTPIPEASLVSLVIAKG